MRRAVLPLALLFALCAFFLARWRWANESQPQHRPRDVARVEPTPITPWRDPAHDLAVFFPPATNYALEPRILSGQTAPIQKKLGRLMRPDENPLRIHRVLHHGQALGVILITRVKGEHGGIEIVTGVETNGTLRGVRIQSQREPPVVAEALASAAWLAGFAGRTAQSPLRVGVDLPDVATEARLSAQAIADAVRDQLIVFSFADVPMEARASGKTPHH